MRIQQLIILLTTAVVLVGAGAWVVVHSWAEQELPAEDGAGAQAPVVAVHLSAAPIHSDNRGNVDPHFERGTWYAFLRDPTATVGRAHALASLRSGIEKQLDGFDVRPALVRGVITTSPGVDLAAIEATRKLLVELGLRNIETPTLAGADR